MKKSQSFTAKTPLAERDEEARQADARRAMAEIVEMRKHVGRATVQEILAWRDEGRK